MTYEELLAENLRLRARIHELEQENARLKGYGSSLLCEPELPKYGSKPIRPILDKDAEIQRRLGVFRGLFRGREDVFAQRFVSKAGKAGYQPVCKNRWSDGCVAHKYKCAGSSDCIGDVRICNRGQSLVFGLPYKKCIFALILQGRAFQFTFDERVCGQKRLWRPLRSDF